MGRVEITDIYRRELAAVYDGEAWKEKVRKMSDAQIFAIYCSFLERGMFDKKPKKEKPVVQISNNPKEMTRGSIVIEEVPQAQQLTLNELFGLEF